MISNPVAHPPTNMIRSKEASACFRGVQQLREIRIFRTNDHVASIRDGSVAKSILALSSLIAISRSRMTRPSRIASTRGEQLVKLWILQCRLRNILVEWRKRDPLKWARWVRPDRRELKISGEVFVERGCGYRSRKTSGGATTLDWKHIFHAMNQEFLQIAADRPKKSARFCASEDGLRRNSWRA